MSYNLQTILSTVSKYKKNSDKTKQVKKRLLYDQAPVGGVSSRYFWGLFIALPFIEYGVIFNPYVFASLGIAQAIIFFIVFLSIVMILIFVLSWFNNNKVVDDIKPLWEEYFPEIELSLILSSGVSPYSDFFKGYSEVAGEGLSDEELHQKLKQNFLTMQEENRELLDAMNRDKKRK